MKEPSNPAGPKASPEVRRAKRWNVVWVVPIVAVLLGAWMLYRDFATHGPIAHIRFQTAEEIYASKTEVRCRSVKIGIVKDVKLTKDLNSVNVTVELQPNAEKLLRRGTRFWVVKPRVSGAQVSGLGTLIQGSYIELDPGPADAKPCTHFTGLEIPPATDRSVPGLRVNLTTDQATWLQIGAPIDYRGFEVGRIDHIDLSPDGKQVVYKAFIRKAYQHLISEHTRFWNSSGLQIKTNSGGISLRTPSIQELISGGVSFGLVNGMSPGRPSEDGMSYTLFSDRDTAARSTFTPTLKFLLLFDQSVRGLTTNSPVEFRGIPIGRISKISFDLVHATNDPRIPVLIEIDPTLVRPKNQDVTQRPDTLFFVNEIRKGLRASLKTGSYITGSTYVDFDYYPDAPSAKLGKEGGYATFPTVSSGLTQLEGKLNALVDKLQAVPLQDSMASLTDAADQIQAMAASARKTLDDPSFQKLPSDLKLTLDQLKQSIASVGPNGKVQANVLDTLHELRATLRSLKAFADLLEKKPNALIFGRGSDDSSSQSDHRPPNFGSPHR